MDTRRQDTAGLGVRVPVGSKLMRAIDNADSVFTCTTGGIYTLTTDGKAFRLAHGENHRPWKDHHRVVFLVKRGDEWHVTMIAPEHLNLLEDHDAGTTP